jgi:hypothetical protein
VGIGASRHEWAHCGIAHGSAGGAQASRRLAFLNRIASPIKHTARNTLVKSGFETAVFLLFSFFLFLSSSKSLEGNI